MILQAGSWPQALDYSYCKTAARREIVLKEYMHHDVNADHLMVKAVRGGKCMCDNGMLFNLEGARCRKSELKKFCNTVVQHMDPTVETSIPKLSQDDQTKIRKILGNEENLYDGCLGDNCLNYDTTEWIVENVGTDEEPATISRCTRCFFPKSFRRKWGCLTPMAPW